MERQHIYLIFLVIILGEAFQISSVSTVVWNITTDPVIFGESVTLTCYVQFGTCKKTEWRKWSGGIKNRLICLNGESYFKDKYKMHLSNKSQDYELEILHFDESDVGCNYTCSCGFDRFTKRLMLKNYIHYPARYYMSDTQVNVGLVTGIITMRHVFPIPSCAVKYGNIILQMTFTAISRFNFTYTYYEIITRYKFKVAKTSYVANVIITCILGPKVLQFTKKVPEVTSYFEDSIKMNLTTLLLLIIGFASLPIVLGILFIKYLEKQQNMRGYQP